MSQIYTSPLRVIFLLFTQNNVGNLVFNPGATLAVEIPAKLLIANASSATDGGSVAAAPAATIDVAEQMNLMVEQMAAMQNEVVGIKGDLLAANAKIVGLVDENADLKMVNVAVKEDHAALKTRVDDLEAAELNRTIANHVAEQAGGATTAINVDSTWHGNYFYFDVYGGADDFKNELARTKLAGIRVLQGTLAVRLMTGAVDAEVFNELVKDLEQVGKISLSTDGKNSGFAGGKGNVVFKSLRNLYYWEQDQTSDCKATSYTFPALRKVTYDMRIQTQSTLQSISLPALLTVGRNLEITDNIKLTKLSLPVLKYAASLNLNDNTALAGSGTDIFINPDLVYVGGAQLASTAVTCTTTNGLKQVVAACKKQSLAFYKKLTEDVQLDSYC